MHSSTQLCSCQVVAGFRDARLLRHAAGLPAGRALDLACGEGRNSVWLAEQGWEVTGVDFSPAGIDKARRLSQERGVHPQWIVANLLDYEPEQRAFDLAIVLYLLALKYSRCYPGEPVAPDTPSHSSNSITNSVATA